MKLQFLGTGATDGWPCAGCQCASCRSAASNPRTATSVLIDDVVRLGAGSDISATLAPGQVMQLPGWQVSALAGSTANRPVLDLIGAGGERVIYADSTGPLPDETVLRLSGAGATALLLEETAGRRSDSRQRHLNLETFPAELVKLRANRAIVLNTAVFAVGLGHANPPPVELADLLWSWGAELPSDGQVYEISAPDRPAPSRPPPGAAARRTLVIGGARSGKSQWAERQLAAELAVSYVATAEFRSDTDWMERIKQHRLRRPPHWQTLQTHDLNGVLTGATHTRGALLIDDLGNWVARTIDLADGWDAELSKYRDAAAMLVTSWTEFAGRIILVSNDVGGGVHPTTKAGRVFSDEMGRLNSALAAESDEVVTVSAGLAQWLRRAPGMIVR